MKKILVMLMALVLLTACGGEAKEELHVYSWGAYIDQDVITSFEKEYGVKVIYDEFNSNEMMYTKLQDGSKYDVIVPSDYMIQRMAEENLLQDIDYSKIPNYSGVLDSLKNPHFDPENKFSVPYFWGNVGLLYNTTTIDKADLDAQGWNILNNEKYKDNVFFYNSERDAFMVALKALGYSMNTSDANELAEANQWLLDMKSKMNPVYVTDEVIDNMESGIKDLAVMYSGDANYVMTENEELDYYVPEQGTNIWLDSMVIPANASNPELAHKWINYMLDPEVSLLITEEVGYTSPLQVVIDTVTGTEGAYEGISSYTPRVGHPKDEEFYFDAQLKVIMNDYWQKIVAAR